jgi:hypothetical protein
MNVNNQAHNLEAASSILEHVVAGSLLTPNLIEQLKLIPYSEPLAGFHVTRAPIYTLGCLLGEGWATEDVLNARAELLYFRRAAAFFGEEPSMLFLPTSFINDCRKLLQLPNTPYSAEIISVRARIRSGNIDMLGFVGWTSNHYSAIFKLSIADLEHGDSLHLPAAPDILRILRWAFAGLRHYEPAQNLVHIKPGLIDRQTTLAGGGSCGIAAMNFIEFRVGLGAPRWRSTESTKFRDAFLRELLLYHLLAREKKTASLSKIFSLPQLIINQFRLFLTGWTLALFWAMVKHLVSLQTPLELASMTSISTCSQPMYVSEYL